MITPAFGQRVELLPGSAHLWRWLSEKRRDALLAAMARRPMDYCAQEIINLSTTPALIEDRFEPRPFTLRLCRAGR
jgi:uncharacterized circularly permuted ATP-grasp superfamily protein